MECSATTSRSTRSAPTRPDYPALGADQQAEPHEERGRIVLARGFGQIEPCGKSPRWCDPPPSGTRAACSISFSFSFTGRHVPDGPW